MTETLPGLPLASFLDTQCHRVTATVTLSGLLAVLAHSPDGSLCSGGHPCLNRDMARVLGEALILWADDGNEGRP